uniref:Uncharacterized protein n=1 Tax=Lotharella globosa TaxID=91324 RepID=A0A7S3YZP2_9EUKA
MSGSDFSTNDSAFVTPRSDRSDLFVTPRSNTQVGDVFSPGRIESFVTPRGGEDQTASPFPFTDVHPLGGVSSRPSGDVKGGDESLEWNIGGKKWVRSPKSGKMKPVEEGKPEGKSSQAQLLAQMFQSARHCKKKEVEAILRQGLPVDTEDKHGNTLYLTACQNGHKRIAKVALRAGANINHKNVSDSGYAYESSDLFCRKKATPGFITAMPTSTVNLVIKFTRRHRDI